MEGFGHERHVDSDEVKPPSAATPLTRKTLNMPNDDQTKTDPAETQPRGGDGLSAAPCSSNSRDLRMGLVAFVCGFIVAVGFENLFGARAAIKITGSEYRIEVVSGECQTQRPDDGNGVIVTLR
jgi:hypothetical protein